MHRLNLGGIVAGLLGLGIVVWLLRGSVIPGGPDSLSHVTRPKTLIEYTCIAAEEFYLPAVFPKERFVVTSTSGDTLIIEPGDLCNYQVLEGSCLPNMAVYSALTRASAYRDLFPNGIQYEPTTTWSKPHPVPWVDGKRITAETAKYFANPVYMPRTRGPINPFTMKFPDVDLPFGFPMAAVKPRYPFGRLWYMEGAGLSDSTGWLQANRRGMLALYPNYDFGGMSPEWNSLRYPWGQLMRPNLGGFRIAIAVWRPHGQ